MWRLLRKKVHAIDPLVRLSIGLSCGLHLIFLIICIIICWLQPVQQIQINRHFSDITNPIIIIDPNFASKGVSQRASAKQTQQSSNAAGAVPLQLSSQKTTVIQEKKSVVVSQKKTAAKPKPAKKATPKKQVEKPKSKPTPKKEAAPVPKSVAQKADAVQKKEPPIKAPLDKKIDAPVVQEIIQPVAPAVAALQAAEMTEPFIIARSASEAAALSVHYAVQEELLRVWRPPVGIDEGLACTVRVTINAQGIMQTVELLKPSGMLVFDVSARAAVQQAVWPHGVWGTILELVLQ